MAFSGVAVYDIFENEIAEDVSDIVTNISPRETPFLNDIGDSSDVLSAKSKAYTWVEDALLPDHYNLDQTVSDTDFGFTFTTDANFLRVQDILRNPLNGEELLVNSVGTNADTIYVARGYADTTAAAISADTQIDFLGSAMTEGAGIREQRRVPKILKTNYSQIFREDLKFSILSKNATYKTPGLMPPYEKEKVAKTAEVIKQLERSVLMGRTNGSTIGADDVETTLAGAYNSIATNIVSNATFSNSIVNNMFEAVHNYTDLNAHINNYTLYCGTTAFRLLSNSRNNRIEQTINETETGVKRTTLYLSDFGDLPVKAIRWLPKGSMLAIRKDFCKVKPFEGDSFAYREYNNGERAMTGYISGTYGFEFHQEKAHGRLDGLAQ